MVNETLVFVLFSAFEILTAFVRQSINWRARVDVKFQVDVDNTLLTVILILNIPLNRSGG